MVYMINGWREGKRYFLSFGFTTEEIERMKMGDVICRNGNEFKIIAEG